MSTRHLDKSSLARSLARYDIDLRQAMVLLVAYLKQDLRSSKTALHTSKSESLTSNRALVLMFFVYALLGISVAVLAFTDLALLTFSTVTLSFTLAVVALALLAESGSVFFSETDAEVLGHLPISSRTHFAAKALNLLTFTFMLAAAANLAPTVTGIWANGSNLGFVAGHILATALVSLFALSLIVVCYGLLIRYVSKERFDNFVAYSQVGMAIFFFMAFQFMPWLAEDDLLGRYQAVEWYHFIYPPAWFSGITLLAVGQVGRETLVLSAIGILSVAALGTVAFRKMAAEYSSLVSQIVLQSAKADKRRETARDEGDAGKSTARSSALQSIKALIVRDPVERAVFDLISIYLRRNREVKVRIYPSLASFIFIPLSGIMTDGLNDPFAGSGSSFFSLMSPQMICFAAFTVIEGMVFSDHYAASYIFRVTPIGDVSRIYSGFRKAVVVYTIAPGFLMLFILFSVLWQNPFHALLVLAPWIALAGATLALPFVYRETLPLSRKYQKGQQSARNMTMFLSSFIGFFLVLGLQAAAAKGYFPYWAFLAGAFIVSPVIHRLAVKLSGEIRPV